MNKMLKRVLAAERLRRAKEQAAEDDRRVLERAEAYKRGLRAGRQEAETAPVTLPSGFMDMVLARAAQEFGAALARRVLDQNVPGQVIAEVAADVWAMMQRGEIRTLGDGPSGQQAYVRWCVEGRGDLRLDVFMPEFRWSYSTDRLYPARFLGRFRA